MKISAHYQLRTDSDGDYNYDAWLIVDDKRVDRRSGMSMAWPDWLNRWSAERQARRACRSMIRKYLREERRPPPKTVTVFDFEKSD